MKHMEWYICKKCSKTYTRNLAYYDDHQIKCYGQTEESEFIPPFTQSIANNEEVSENCNCN